MSLDALQYLSSLCGRTNQTLTEDEALDWQRKVFSRYPNDQVVAALSAHADRSAFRPQISDVLKLLGAQTSRSALLALNELVNLVRKVGPYKSPQIQDAALAMSIQELGGWPTLCNCLPDPSGNEMAYDRFSKRFAQIYEMCVNQVQVLGVRLQTPPMGLIEAAQNGNRSDQQAPKLQGPSS